MITKIEEICRKEGKVVAAKEWLGVLFFLASIIVAWIFIKALSTPVTNPLLVMKHDAMVVEKLLITLMTFTVAIISGYLLNWTLSKKMDRLWKQKKALL